MKELDFIKIIENSLSKEYIGDDCAYLKDLGIVVTQDSLVENIHFKREFSTPFQLGYKSVAVNLSDVYASGAEAKYLTISLSLPKDIDKEFITEFYEGAKSVLNGAKIVGGDITGSDKIFISVTAIGSTSGRKISSRKNAKVGYKIITNGIHGSSGAGLYLLQNHKKNEALIKEHLTPNISSVLSDAIATSAQNDYAMMDSSDGLADALFKIAEASNLTSYVNFDKIPYDKHLENIKEIDYKKMIFFGGEDYKLICAIADDDLRKINPNLYTVIGEIKERNNDELVKINFGNKIINLTKKSLEENLFSHF